MTEVFNNQIACLITKNRNLPQRRHYHFTNSLLLPTDNQLLGMIANPDIINPTTPDADEPQTFGEPDATSSNTQTRDNVEEKARKAKVRKAEYGERRNAKKKAGATIVTGIKDKLARQKEKLKETNAKTLAQAHKVDKATHMAYSSENQGKSNEVRYHPTDKTTAKKGKERGEDHPITRKHRKRAKGNINQRNRDHGDHDDIMRNGRDERDPSDHRLPPDTREVSKIQGYSGIAKKTGASAGASAGGGGGGGGGSGGGPTKSKAELRADAAEKRLSSGGSRRRR